MSTTKVRIYELSKELGLESSKDLIGLLEDEFGVEIKSPSSTIDQDLADKVAALLKKKKAGGKAAKAEPEPKKAATKTPAKAAASKKAAPSPMEEAISTKKVVAKTPEPKIEEEPDEPSSRPAIDPSRVRVIKRQPQPVAAEPEAPAQPVASVVEPPKPVIHEFKTPIVESKRYLIEGGPAPEPPAPAQPKPGELSKKDIGRVTESRSETKPATPNKEVTAETSTTEEAASATAPKTDVPYRSFQSTDYAKQMQSISQQLQSGAAKPVPGEKEVGRRTFIDKSWPQEKSIIPGRGGKKNKKMQAYYERQDALRKEQEEEEAFQSGPKIISIKVPMTVAELAKELHLKDTELIKHLFMKGVMVTVNQTLDIPYARSISKDFEFTIQEELDELERATAPKEQYDTLDTGKKELDTSVYKHLVHRAPVVSIMGHVDHGKTTLLDAIRETRHKIVDSEAGGITQSIGAYTVEKDGQKIVFLDTPGHEAFTAMRMRGAKSTDIAILVVAADDGVMPQTIEALNHAKAAKIPIIVAVNKIDKEDADPDRVLGQLTEYGLASEKWGGDTITVEVSALQKLGLEDLLDNILLVAELQDLKADATVPAEGIIIEAQLDKRMGPIASVLVQQGTLKIGDNLAIGAVGGRVRALIDDTGTRIQEAGPATPVEVLGLSAVPNAGEIFQVINDEKRFRQVLDTERLKEREQRLTQTRTLVMPGFTPGGLESNASDIGVNFNVVVKADTQGSLEAVCDVLRQLSTDEIKVNILHSGTGDMSEADIMLASTGNALVVGFNVKLEGNAEALAKQQALLVKLYDVIYHITEDVEKIMLGKLSPETEEIESGRAEVRQIFKVGKTQVAGCMVTSGKLLRNAKAVVLRDGKEIHSGSLTSLKRFKDDAKEVASGYECGLGFEKFNDLQEGDVVAVFITKELERTSL